MKTQKSTLSTPNKTNNKENQSSSFLLKSNTSLLNHKMYSSNQDMKIQLIANRKEELEKKLLTEQENHRLEVQTIRSQIHQFEDKVVVLEKVKIEQEQQINYLRNILQKREKQIEQLESQQQIIQKKEDLPIEAQKPNNQQKEILSLTQQIQRFQATIKNLQRENKELKEQKKHSLMEFQQGEQIKLIKQERQAIQNQNRKLKKELVDEICRNETKIKILQEQVQFRNNKAEKQVVSFEKLLNEKMKEKEKQISMKQSQIIKLREQNQSNIKNFFQINGKIQQLEKVNEQIKTELQQEVEEVKKYKRFNEENIKMIEQLQQSSQKIQKQCNSAKEQRDQEFKEIFTLKQKHQEDLIVIKELNLKINEKEQQLMYYNKSVEDLMKTNKIQIEEKSQINSLVDCYKKKLLDRQEKEIDFRHQINIISQQKEQKQRQINKIILEKDEEIGKVKKDMMMEKKQLQCELECMKLEVEKIKEYGTRNIDEFDNLKRQNKKIKKMHEELQTERENLLYKIKGLQSDLQETENKQKEQSRTHNTQLQTKLRQYEIKYKREVEQLQQFMNKKVQEKEKEHVLQITKVKCKAQQEWSSEISKLKANFETEIHQIKRQKEEIKSCNERLTREKSYQGASEEEKQFWESKVMKSEKTCSQLYKKINELSFEIESKNNKIFEFNEEMRKMKQKLNQQLQNKRLEIDGYKLQIRESENREEKISQYNKQNQMKMNQLRGRISELEEEVWKLQDKNKQLKRLKDRNQSEIDSLSKELTIIDKSHSSTHQLELEKLNIVLKHKAEQVQCLKSEIKMKQEEIHQKDKLLKDQKRKYEEKSRKLELEMEQKTGKETTERKIKIQFEILQNKTTLLQKQNEKLKKQSIEKTKQFECEIAERKQVYRKLCELKNEFFSIEGNKSEIEFVKNLYQKLRIWIEYAEKMKKELMEEKQKRKFKQSEMETLKMKEEYTILYTKYKKYKQGYMSLKNKFQSYQKQTFNDQRFTEEIISHCRHLIQP